jgi:hypothetical protein
MDLSHLCATQADNLPAENPSIALLDIPMLTAKMSRNKWCRNVIIALGPHCLGQLVDSSVGRPEESDFAKYAKWNFWSKLIYGWMYFHIEESVRDQINNIPGQADNFFADTLFHTVRYLPRTDEAFDFDKAYMHWARIKRANYGSVEAFIIAYRNQCQAIHELNQPTNLPIALLCLLLQVRDELPRVEEDMVLLHHSPVIDFQTFSAYCDALVLKACAGA